MQGCRFLFPDINKVQSTKSLWKLKHQSEKVTSLFFLGHIITVLLKNMLFSHKVWHVKLSKWTIDQLNSYLNAWSKFVETKDYPFYVSLDINKQTVIECGLVYVLDRDRDSRVVSLAGYYLVLLAHLLVHDYCTCTVHIKVISNSTISNSQLDIEKNQESYTETNQSFEVIHRSSRFTTPSS